jgi:hypothetical protein
MPMAVKRKLEELLTRYGPIALWTYLVIFVIVLAAFAGAIAMGADVESASGGATTLGAAWLATKVTQPLRIAATFVLTPVVARGVDALRGKPRGGGGTPTAG